MSNSQQARLTTWLVEPMPRDVARSVEKLRRQEDVVRVALMPDVHLAQDVCIGVALATRQLVYPAAVGGDIGCGMATVAVDARASDLDDERHANHVLKALHTFVPTNKHPQSRSLPSSLQEVALSHPTLERDARRDGSVQFGTLGRGNHFLEFQADEDDRLWIMVHSGSRAMGQSITRHHCTNKPNGGLLSLDTQTDEGRHYLADVAWARKYAAENRLAMLQAAEALLSREFHWSVDWSRLIHSDHNHVQWEVHEEAGLWVHRKGAQAVPGDTPGLIPGSMGTPSFQVLGRGNPESLASCSHGAGRQVPRGMAARSISTRRFDHDTRNVWMDRRKADRLRDEAPSAYKDIRAVMRAQRDLVRITRELRPILNYKGV